jgi:hypothetical protein
MILAPEREVPCSTSGRFLTIGSSLPLAEVTAAGSLVATGSLSGTPELPAPCWGISLRDLLEGESLFFYWSFGPFVLFLVL